MTERIDNPPVKPVSEDLPEHIEEQSSLEFDAAPELFTGQREEREYFFSNNDQVKELEFDAKPDAPKLGELLKNLPESLHTLYRIRIPSDNGDADTVQHMLNPNAAHPKADVFRFWRHKKPLPDLEIEGKESEEAEILPPAGGNEKISAPDQASEKKNDSAETKDEKKDDVVEDKERKGEISKETKPDNSPESMEIEQASDKQADEDRIVRNSSGKIEKIVYAGGEKVREFKYDTSGNNLVEITERNGKVERTYVKRAGSWFCKVGNLELPVSGSMRLKDDGGFAYQIKAGPVWQVEHPDGSVTQERDTVAPPPDSSPVIDIPKVRNREIKIEKNENGKVEKVTLPDGSTRSFIYDPDGKELLQITDRRMTAGGERVSTWTRQFIPGGKFGDKFERTHPPGSSDYRKNIVVKDNGEYEYDGRDGRRDLARLAGGGDKVHPWESRITRDDQGNCKVVDNSNYRREYEYFPGSDKIRSYTVTIKETGKSYTWSRNDINSDRWNVQSPGSYDSSTYVGTHQITSDGVHIASVSPAGSRSQDGPAAYLPDGSKAEAKVSADGTLVVTKDGNLTYLKLKDGSSITKLSDSEIHVFNKETEERVDWTRRSDGMWKSDSPYEPDLRKDLSFTEKGELTYVAEDGNKHSRDIDGLLSVRKSDGSQLKFDSAGNLVKVLHQGRERTFFRRDGQIFRVTDKDGKGERIVFPPSGKSGLTVENVNLSKDGDFTYELKDRNGLLKASVKERTNGVSIERDSDGFIASVRKSNGVSRQFAYVGEGKDKQLAKVTDNRLTTNGVKSTTWSREFTPDGRLSDKFISQTDSGKARTPRRIIAVNDDGEYEYTTDKQKPGDKPRIARLSTRDGADGFISESVEDAHLNFLEIMEQHLDEPRLKRMEAMMKEFESRMQDRVKLRKLAGLQDGEKIEEDVAKTVARTYDHLGEMVTNSSGSTFYDQKTRAFLAENFMFHAQDPTTMDQGPASGGDWDGHGTCWIQSAHIWGMTQRTDHMADLLKQISLKGQFTTKNGGEKGHGPKTVSFSRNYLSFPRGRQESSWTISKATDEWDRQPGMIRQCDGDRSPVGKIFDYVLPVIGGRPARAARMDGGTYESFTTTGDRWYVGNAEIMYMVTGDKPVDVPQRGYSPGHLINGSLRLSLLEKGTVLNYKPGHLRSIHLKRVDGQWCLIQDDQHGETDDRIIARITDIERWAKGDRSAEQRVGQRIAHKKYKVAVDYSLGGTVKPSDDSNEYSYRRSRYYRRSY